MPTRHPAGSRSRSRPPGRRRRTLSWTPALVRKVRMQLGLTKTAMAAQVGKSLDQWSRYETGETRIPPSVGLLLAVYLREHDRKGGRR